MHNKRNNQKNEKVTDKMKKIFASCISDKKILASCISEKWLTVKIYNKLKQFNDKKLQPSLKREKELNKYFSKIT